ncbi:MAG: toxic anion resistance protein, partial [Proteobacteria bacterium]
MSENQKPNATKEVTEQVVMDEAQIETKADEFVTQLLDFTPNDQDAQIARKNSVEQMGFEVQKRAAKQSEILRQPVKKMAQTADDGGDVANALISLKMKVEELDPGKLDFEAGWFSRTVGMIPGIGTPLKSYFAKYESAQTVIASIVRSLENGRDQLTRDNLTLQEDQKQMRDTALRLEQAVKLGQSMDRKIQVKLEREVAPDDARRKF